MDQEKETSKSIGVGDKSFDNLLLDLLSAPLQFPHTISTAKLLASNTAPSEAQYMYFQSVIEHGWEDMQKLSQRLIRACTIMDYLDGQLELAITNVEDAQTIMHPMQQVNDDILEMIFQYCAETESSQNSIDVRGMPWTLSHVCGCWRSLVMNTGRLWTRVRLNLSCDEVFMGSVGASYLISSQFLRAAPFKVDMTIEGYPGDSMVNSVFPVLVPFSPQIWLLKIKASPSACRFLSVCKGFFPCLQSLLICGASYHSKSLETNDMYQDLTLDAFTFAPNLECLQIHELPLRSLYFVSTTLNSITQFSISLYSQLSTVLERTAQMGRLETLDLICNCDIDDIDDDPDPVTILSLHQLVLHDLENWQTILFVWDKIFASQVTMVILSYDGSHFIVTYPILRAPVMSIMELHIHLSDCLINMNDHCSLMIKFLHHTLNLTAFYI
ncbi:hypothetical protein ARMGADRAFT_1084572 [Armillaria gallica]|uniref:F-box domain-containing protein n=1 Tax=Armillaria gallica TaxID=47427 RepID=A0A2H3DK24_ARMGA|nr:hypothetical protein ARMGADRAFT_1084572 [Armillaria gallica]